MVFLFIRLINRFINNVKVNVFLDFLVQGMYFKILLSFVIFSCFFLITGFFSVTLYMVYENKDW
jgi:hypothetical protein